MYNVNSKSMYTIYVHFDILYIFNPMEEQTLHWESPMYIILINEAHNSILPNLNHCKTNIKFVKINQKKKTEEFGNLKKNRQDEQAPEQQTQQ